MARGFGATHGVANRTDCVTTALDSYATVRTWSIWMYVDVWENLKRAWTHREDAGETEEWLMSVSPNRLRFFRVFTTTSGNWSVPAPTLDAWHHVLYQYDSSSPDNDPLVWIDNVAQTVTEIVAPVGTAVTTAGLLYKLGNVGFDAGQDLNINGRLAEFCVIDRAMTAQERLDLFNEVNPKTIFGADLVEYVPMLETDDPVVSCLNAHPAVVGTRAQPHPFVSYGCAGAPTPTSLLLTGVGR